MRRLIPTLLLIATALPLVMACSSTPQCSIKGTVTSQLDSVWLFDMDGNILDASAVQDGAFAFTCDRNKASVVTIQTKNQSSPLPLIPDVKEIQVTLGDGSATSAGSPLSDELQELQSWIFKQFDDSNEKAMALYAEGKNDEASAVMEEMHQALTDHCREVYLKHLQDPIGIQAMNFLIDAIPDEEFISLYEKGGDLIHDDASIGGYYESLTQTGFVLLQPQPDGSFAESEGTLDSFIGQGKYVLVDFWASWCGPCKEETPFVVKAYNDYKDKGLVVLGIPVQDKQDATKKAMADMGIRYPQLMDPGGKLAEKYDVIGIPHLFLFGPDGEIVRQGMRGEETDAILAGLLQ